jgi:hypothetical protein
MFDPPWRDMQSNLRAVSVGTVPCCAATQGTVP